MKKLIFCLFFSILLVACVQDYQKEIVGWWVSDDATRSQYVLYIIREDGTYKKRMKGNWFGGAAYDGTDRGLWKINGKEITFHVETYNNKPQNDRNESYKIKLLNDKQLILQTGDNVQFRYIKDE